MSSGRDGCRSRQARVAGLRPAQALAEGVVCRPGERFFGDTDADVAKQWFRLNFTMIDPGEIERGIAALGTAIAASVR